MTFAYTPGVPVLKDVFPRRPARRLTSAGVAIAVSVLIGFLIATAITSRVKRLADSAGRITDGRLDEPVDGTGGRDEIAGRVPPGDDAGGAAGDLWRAASRA